MSRIRLITGAGLLCAASLALAACGTRLPDSAFGAQAVVVPGASTGPGATGALPSAGPSASAGPSTGPGRGPSGVTGPGAVAVAPGKGAPGNTASDIGVTATTIRLGLVASVSNPFDPTTFAGPLYGAEAFFYYLNQHGGIHGRTVELSTCDDHGDGGRNQTCIHSLIDDTKVFALTSQSIFKYDGASYVQQKGVPDIGSQPIDNAYNTYSHLYDVYGEVYPRNGTIGYDGKLEGGTEVYTYMKKQFPGVPLKAGVLYYNQSDSERYGQSIAQGLKLEGFQVVTEQVNFALPNFDSAVLDMKSKGVRFVFDALDSGGNENLCASMDSSGLSDQIAAKVTTTQSWTANIGLNYSQSPKCRNKLWATGNTLNYDDTSYPPVVPFRDSMHRLHLDGPNQMSEWALEGWGGAQWLADAMDSCGADLTRTCVEAYMNRSTPYTGHGLFTPRDFVKEPRTATSYNCLNAAKWDDSLNGGKGGWKTMVKDMDTNCVHAHNVFYDA